ncbi:DedA family protein [Aurantimonas sp. HBX-1]|uniref:DedA family protein n=1 Tax=Aurantimonas sp. HBX-1 TaxID=2906072 RepID=UPI001F1EDE17|nr:DedA family protein [Aurantimonas sp. HBX-1]UIJ73169.1 DedA family protein [Aurantimonas sp. HBX-1]
MNLADLIAHYGLAALFVGSGLEGETVVVFGGLMAHRGFFGFGPAVLAAAAGSFIADQIFFALGRRYRDTRLVRRIRERPGFRRALRTFERYPNLFIFGFRFVYGLRTVSPVAIGTTDVSAWRFVAVNAVAACTWAATFVSLGYLFSRSIEAVMGRLGPVEHWAIGAVGVALLLVLLIRFARRRRAGPLSGMEKD